MKVVLTGNTKDKYKRLTWNDMQPCSTCNSLECENARSGHERDMNIHNTCIDLIEANGINEILEIWTNQCYWQSGFTNIQFYPAAGEPMVILEIVPQNEDDVLAMNQTYYERLKGIAYDENDPLRNVENTLKIWVKNLKDDIQNRFLKSEISKKEYQELEVESIWEMVDQQKKVSQISFRSIVDEELVRIKRGKSLISNQKLIQDEYKIPDYAGYDWFDVKVFIHRIIASDIARIILDMERIMDEPPDDQRTSFKWRSKRGQELPDLYQKMKGVLIASETTLEQFTAIFTGQPIKSIEPVEWISQTVLLAYFIAQLRTTHNKIEETELWAIAGNCFGRNRSTLFNSYDQYLRNTTPNKKPKDHKIIDELFD